MNLIKKNIILFSVLTIALGLSAFFVYKVINETNNMNSAAVKVEELKKKITELNKQTPIPNKPNYDKIMADAKNIAEKTKKLNKIFGKIYLPAAKAFTKALGVPYEDFVEQWKKAYDSKGEDSRDLFFSKFFAKFGKEKVESAMNAFYATIKNKEKSLESLNAANINDSIMEAFGLPRSIQPISCKTYLMDMQDNFIAYMEEAANKDDNPFILGTGVEGNSVEKFTFDKFEGGALPRPNEVAFIFKHLKLIEDILIRLKTTGVQSLDEITKESLQGELKSEYLVFTYTLKLSAPLKNIRLFINSLLEAFKQNRIYVIKTIALTSKEDVSSVVKFDSSSSKTNSSARRRGYNRVPSGGDREKASKGKTSRSGVPIMGNNNTVTATIKFEYIIYVGDELTEK